MSNQITLTPLPDAVTSTDEIVAMLQKEEGFSSAVYVDRGQPDIGYGFQLNAGNLPYILQAMGADNGSSDIAGGATLTLAASLPDPLASGGVTQAAPITINYVPATPDTSTAPPPGNVITGHFNSSTQVTVYTGDGGNDLIAAGAGPNLINAQSSGDHSTHAVAYGWFALLAIATISPASGATPFRLTQGRGLPVCEAYAGLLNRAHYDVDPFCGRPGSDPAHGFDSVPRHDLSAGEILPLFNYVHAFMHFDDQHHVERTYRPNNKDPAKSYWTTDMASYDDIVDFLSRYWLHAWTVDAPIDIENDGTMNRVLVWQGYGAEDNGAYCGGSYPSQPWDFPYIPQRAFILTPDGKQIDERKTRAIFGAPEGVLPPDRSHLPVNEETPFRPLADSIGIFRYAGRYYLDTENIPKHPAGGTVVVYERRGGHTRRICTLR